MVSVAAIWAATASPISSLKYGKCQVSGASTTPSSEMNRPATIFRISVPFWAVSLCTERSPPTRGSRHRGRVEGPGRGTAIGGALRCRDQALRCDHLVGVPAEGTLYQRSDDMKYVVLIYSNPATWQEVSKAEADRIIGEHFRVIEELTSSGELLSQFGLADASNTKTLRVDTGAPVVTDGPFTETKEQLAGVFLVDCDSVERVLEFSEVLAQGAVVEVRPVMEDAGTEM